MNHLEQLKQQLMVKPDVKERERVAVVIKGEKKQRKIKAPTAKKKTEKTIGEQIEEGIADLGEQISEIQQMEGILPAKVDIAESEEEDEQDDTEIGKNRRPIIIDRTQEGYDIKSLLKKLAESKKTKVTIKPVLEIGEKEIEPISGPAVKKAKKLDIKKP
jgi:hypothetical protein